MRDFEKHYHTHNGHKYLVKKLWKDVEGLEAFDLPLKDFKKDWAWESKMNIKKFTRHMKQVMDANLDYPIILHYEGHVMDGYHRICKAILLGHKTIKAVTWKGGKYDY